jgi:hypothetical protein
MSEFNLEWSHKHDRWNILSLPVVFGANLYYLLVDDGKEAEWAFVIWFLEYLVLDFVWIAFKPCSVSAPNLMLMHHVVTIAGVALIPSVNGTVKHAICLTSLVEINTWIRMLKKILWCQFELDMLFLLSWIVIRCMLGPYVQILLWKDCWHNLNSINGTLFLVGVVLNGLSVKWSYDLAMVVKQRYCKE